LEELFNKGYGSLKGLGKFSKKCLFGANITVVEIWLYNEKKTQRGKSGKVDSKCLKKPVRINNFNC
jgi:hypothetical protein